MNDEKTQAAVERLEAATNVGEHQEPVIVNKTDIKRVLAALDAANERAERECVWTQKPYPADLNHATSCGSEYHNSFNYKFCPNCGGKVKEATNE